MAKKLIKVKKVDGEERKYKVQVVSQTIGLSEGAITGYFSNKGISVKDGITAQQVIDVVNGRRRGDGIDWDAVEALTAELASLGYEIVDSDELDDKEDK